MLRQSAEYGPVRAALAPPVQNPSVRLVLNIQAQQGKGRQRGPPGYERVAASRVQRVDVTAGVVKHPVPKVLGKLEGHFPLGQRHLFTMPNVHLTAEVKDQHLQTGTETQRCSNCPS